MKILTLDELQEKVPAAFATGPSPKASDRYAFIPTVDLIAQLGSRGWFPVRAHQSTRMQDSVHAMHKIEFRNSEANVTINDVFPEVILINSHDLTRRYSLLAGFFRLVCSNGMVISAGVGETRDSKIHIDDVLVDVERSLDRAITTLQGSVDTIKQWQNTELSWLAKQDFARDAILIKNGGDQYWSKHFQPHEFLRVRRDADRANDLWTIFNVVQENIMKGGVQGVTRETRPITQVREVVRINQDLWQLAEKYGQLHGRN